MPIFQRPAPQPAPPPVVNVQVPPSDAAAFLRRPFIRTGIYAWAGLGTVGMLIVAARVAGALSIVVIPLILALFPAAVLAPLAGRLRQLGLPASLAAGVAILGTIGVFVGIGFALAPQVSGELGGIGEQIDAGIQRLESFLLSGPFGLDPIRLDELIARARDQLTTSGSELTGRALEAVTVFTETIAGLLFGLVALFLYLKDGPRMARWLRDLFPEQVRDDAAEVGVRAWQTLGAYVRGQVIIAFIDAVLIGIGIFILGVPLAVPLIVLIFFTGLFPIVGAVIGGAVAVLVALATTGPGDAVILLGVIVVVQQLEGDLLAPVVMGKATQLHPLATLAALTAGAVLLGVLGAFLAIPVTASITRAASYLRQRRKDREGLLAV